MILELAEHGYTLSPGTLYPILHNLEKDGLLMHFTENCQGKLRKYYSITEPGQKEFIEAKKYLAELVGEIGLVKESPDV